MLKKIPNQVYSLTNLEFLDLTLNLIDTIPPDIKMLTKLRELDLSNNCFKSIPVAVTELSNLEYLDFDNPEKAGKFPDGTQSCQNELTIFPDISKMTSIKTISIHKLILNDENIKVKMYQSYKKEFKGSIK